MYNKSSSNSNHLARLFRSKSDTFLRIRLLEHRNTQSLLLRFQLHLSAKKMVDVNSKVEIVVHNVSSSGKTKNKYGSVAKADTKLLVNLWYTNATTVISLKQHDDLYFLQATSTAHFAYASEQTAHCSLLWKWICICGTLNTKYLRRNDLIGFFVVYSTPNSSIMRNDLLLKACTYARSLLCAAPSKKWAQMHHISKKQPRFVADTRICSNRGF